MTAPSLTLAQYNQSAPTYQNGTESVLQTDANGLLKVVLGGNSQITTQNQSWNGIAGRYTAVAAATTNVAAVKNGQSSLFRVTAWNSDTTGMWLKLFNKNGGAPVLGTDTPIEQIYLPPGSSITHTFGSNGSNFQAGIGVALTAGAALLDSTALANANTAGFVLSYS